MTVLSLFCAFKILFRALLLAAFKIVAYAFRSIKSRLAPAQTAKLWGRTLLNKILPSTETLETFCADLMQ